MIARKLLCLLLAAVFFCATVPLSMAGDTPPPGSDDRNIHPWDNNDGQAAGDPLEVIVRPGIFFGFGPSGQLFWVTFTRVEKSSQSADSAKPLVRRNVNTMAKSKAVGR